jgi:hypothetical protein
VRHVFVDHSNLVIGARWLRDRQGAEVRQRVLLSLLRPPSSGYPIPIHSNDFVPFGIRFLSTPPPQNPPTPLPPCPLFRLTLPAPGSPGVLEQVDIPALGRILCAGSRRGHRIAAGSVASGLCAGVEAAEIRKAWSAAGFRLKVIVRGSEIGQGQVGWVGKGESNVDEFLHAQIYDCCISAVLPPDNSDGDTSGERGHGGGGEGATVVLLTGDGNYNERWSNYPRMVSFGVPPHPVQDLTAG